MAEIYGDNTGGQKASHRNWALIGLLAAIAIALVIYALAARYG